MDNREPARSNNASQPTTQLACSSTTYVDAATDTDIARIRAAAEVLEPGDVLIADANTGWLTHQAARVVRGVRDVDVYIEQPCLSYEECLSIRRRTDHPFVLDECVDGVDMLMRAHADRAMDCVNLKISKLGGLTKARQLRDLCVLLGIPMTIEDSWDVGAGSRRHVRSARAAPRCRPTAKVARTMA